MRDGRSCVTVEASLPREHGKVGSSGTSGQRKERRRESRKGGKEEARASIINHVSVVPPLKLEEESAEPEQNILL